ncbi:MAG: hypothetical protein ACXAC7_16250, partial [Candidatus Hodarchaeales archaeon]
FLNESLASSEKNLGGLLLSLPFSNRNHFRSRQIITIVAGQVPTIVLTILTITTTNFTSQFLQRGVMQIFLNIIAMTSYLILFSLFFGKLNNRYTLFELNIEKKILKTIIMIVLLYLVLFSNIIVIEMIYLNTKAIFDNYWVVIFIINVIYLLVIEIVARKIFK